MNLNPDHQSPLVSSSIEGGFGPLLVQEAPVRRTFWWLLPLLLLLGVLGLRVYLSLPAENPANKSHTPKIYTVTDDPDEAKLRKIQEILDREKSTKKDEAPAQPLLAPVKPGYLRVAAAQIATEMGKVEKNRRKMEAYARKAANAGAKILVFPEAALPGYADPDKFHYWATEPKKDPQSVDADYDYSPVEPVAEPANGDEVAFFAKLAAELKIYIAFPFVEKSGSDYFSAVCLLNDKGEAALTRRKEKLWAPGDLQWATPAKEGAKTVETPLGKIGLVISYDMRSRFPELRTLGADIILHSAAFYGQNLQAWADGTYQKMVKESGSAVILANWGSSYIPANWDGYGLSRIYSKGGTLLAGQGTQEGEFLVIADLPTKETHPTATEAAPQSR